MATHSSILAWRIPWTEEPGLPQSMGFQELDTTERLSTAQVFRTDFQNHPTILPPMHLTPFIIQSEYIGQVTS